MRNKKDREITIRVSDILFRKILAICKVTGKSKTGLIRDLVLQEYEKNKKYEAWFDSSLRNMDKK